MTNAASGAVNAASNAVRNAESAAANALNTASNIRNSLSGGAQSLLDSATNDVSLDSLTENAQNLSPKDLLETIEGATLEIEARVEGAQQLLDSTVHSISDRAEEALLSATSSWNCPVKKVVDKAIAAGIDVQECAVDGVLNLAKDSTTSAVKCVTDKVKEAVTLGKNIANVPVRAAKLAKDGVTGYNSCRNSYMKRVCQGTKLVPVAVKSALLVKDTISYATQATTLVTTIQSQLTACATGVAAKSAAQAAATGGKIVKCVSGKLSGN